MRYLFDLHMESGLSERIFKFQPDDLARVQAVQLPPVFDDGAPPALKARLKSVQRLRPHTKAVM